jgi:hypothetical protein
MTDEERWRQEFSEGKLTQDEFETLMKGKKSLNEMDDLLKKGDDQ